MALPPSKRLVRFILSTSDTVSRTIFIVSCSQTLSSVPSSLSLEGRKLLVGLAPHILPNGIGCVQATKTHRTEDSVHSSGSPVILRSTIWNAQSRRVTLETGLQIASDLLIDSIHSRNPSLRRPTNRRVCIGLYANNKWIYMWSLSQLGLGYVRPGGIPRLGCRRVHLSDTGHRPSSARLASGLSIGICYVCYACAYPNNRVGCARCVRLLFPIIGGEVAQPLRAMY